MRWIHRAECNPFRVSGRFVAQDGDEDCMLLLTNQSIVASESRVVSGPSRPSRPGRVLPSTRGLIAPSISQATYSRGAASTMKSGR